MKKVLPIVLALLVTVAYCKDGDYDAYTFDDDLAQASVVLPLKQLYLQHNYQAAYDNMAPKFRAEFKVDTLKQIVEQMETFAGKVIEIRGESFMPLPPRRYFVLLFKGKNEKGTTYHRIIIAMDKENLYKIVGLWVNSAPYPDWNSGIKFDKPVTIK